ncbi:sensor histidine kinase [Nocardiopsis aegyptia]|uniref:histidine kinase n=1 Tax=Nocardiopsis aegyptia TaxID=220378 RepID=A0A7Z0EHP9_9ACTN|nr:histidine kinase [Nocardiopsis aegyptia]NYJ32273.1 signal transduction histidine kinase [Nocardiopsis aegyptia]
MSGHQQPDGAASTDAGGGADVGAAGPPGRWLREHARLVDAVVVAVVFTYNLFVIGPFTSPDGRPVFLAQLAISVLLCGLYPLRRRSPFTVFGAMLLAACAQVLVAGGSTLLFADLVLVFTVHHMATRFRWTVSVPAAVLVAAWLPLAAAPMLRAGHMTIDAVVALVLVIAWAWTWGTLVRVRRAHIAGLQDRARQLEREREVQARIVAARERARIARELHDIVAHSLGVMVVVADGASTKASTEPERAREAMVRVRDTGRTAMAEMRRMLHILRDDEPGELSPQPGTARLERLVEDSRAAGLPVALTVEGDPVPLAPGPDLAVYRVVQEALTNVRGHAGPALSRAEVVLRYRDSEVEVRVTDDGRGDAGADASPGGHGLVGMRERVAACGGTVRAGGRPGGGFEVVAVVPTGSGR